MGKGSFDEIGSTDVSKRWMFLMVVTAQIAGLIALILLGVVLGRYQGGFDWTVSFIQGQNDPIVDSLLHPRIQRKFSIITRYSWFLVWLFSMAMVS